MSKTYDHLVSLYKATHPPKPFPVTLFECEKDKNNHRFIVEDANQVEYPLGFLTPRMFIGITDEQIHSHRSRRENWQEQAKQKRLEWEPVVGEGKIGQFIINKESTESDGDSGNMTMKEPKPEPNGPEMSF